MWGITRLEQQKARLYQQCQRRNEHRQQIQSRWITKTINDCATPKGLLVSFLLGATSHSYASKSEQSRTVSAIRQLVLQKIQLALLSESSSSGERDKQNTIFGEEE